MIELNLKVEKKNNLFVRLMFEYDVIYVVRMRSCAHTDEWVNVD